MKDDESGDPSGEGFDPWFRLTGNTGSGTELIEETRRFGRGHRATGTAVMDVSSWLMDTHALYSDVQYARCDWQAQK